jgi:hypothetical protein
MYYLFLIIIPIAFFLLLAFLLRKMESKGVKAFKFWLKTGVFFSIVLFIYSFLLGVFTNASMVEKYFKDKAYPSYVLSIIAGYLLIALLPTYAIYLLIGNVKKNAAKRF